MPPLGGDPTKQEQNLVDHTWLLVRGQMRNWGVREVHPGGLNEGLLKVAAGSSRSESARDMRTAEKESTLADQPCLQPEAFQFSCLGVSLDLVMKAAPKHKLAWSLSQVPEVVCLEAASGPQPLQLTASLHHQQKQAGNCQD